MIVIAPGKHPEADKFWKEELDCKPNGARTLGSAMEENLADLFEPYYDMMVCYASDINFEIPDGVKKIAVMWHQNFPWVSGFRCWQRVNNKLLDYDVDYFVNEQKLVGLIKDVYPKVYYLPRFIDTSKYPDFKKEKDIDTLWFGNAWGEFTAEFDAYKHSVKKPVWITHGSLGIGDDVVLEHLERSETLETLARAKTVYAIGISQLEAQYYGAKVVSYRGPVLPFYNQNSIRRYVKQLLKQKSLDQREPKS